MFRLAPSFVALVSSGLPLAPQKDMLKPILVSQIPLLGPHQSQTYTHNPYHLKLLDIEIVQIKL
jgi:hypothetical protein